ncbi:MAG: hypothetical protein AB4042_05290, partial [Leptolyngbyaceae cyanobacterium]
SFAGQQGDWLFIYNFQAKPYAQVTLALHILTLIGLSRVNKWLNRPLHPPESAPSLDLLEQSPARFYRKQVRFGLSVSHANLPPPSPAEEKLEAYLDALYVRQQQRLEQHRKAQASPAMMDTDTFGMFVIASGLFTFGRLEMVPDILDNMPNSGEVRRLALVITALLPLPEAIEPLTDAQAVMDWVEDYRAQLMWDSTLEQFVLAASDH